MCNEQNARNFQTISWDGEVSDDCISCGICAELCPQEAITLKKGAINVDLDSCIMCETCGIHCPTDAIPKVTSVKYEISGGFNYIDENLCVKCGLCKDICGEDAIHTVEISDDEINLGTKNKRLRFVVDDDKCIYCGACMNICPSKSFIFEREFNRVN
jgi:energy-converting hydrogenase B subunit K